MIEIEEKKKCCGCTACVSVCPSKCIVMEKDDEGFDYPHVNVEKCTICNLCESVCPVLDRSKALPFVDINKFSSKEDFTKAVIDQTHVLPDAYVVFLKDEMLRNDSTSGGYFTAIAKNIIAKNGLVYGVEVDYHKNIIHSSASTCEEFGRFRGSKYVQSEQSGIYSDIRENLNSDKWVLYTGTPCQVEGLKCYLGKEYEKLVTVDIICHGVGSPKYWKKYVDFMEQKYGSEISKVKFREKTYGYNSPCMAVYFKNGKSSHKGHDDDLYWTAFSKFYIFRPSCYDCVFKTINHSADFSVGDFWNTSDLDEKYRNANGCSLILVHSTKAQKLLVEISNTIEMVSIDLNKALIINGGPMPSKLITSSPVVEKRQQFMKDMNVLPLDLLTQKYMPLSWKQHLKCMIKPLLYKIGLLNIAKQLKK